MALIFQERQGGYRVVRMNGDQEIALAHIHTADYLGNEPATPMTDDEFKAAVAKDGLDNAMAARKNRESGSGPAIFKRLPYEQCTVHSAVGALEIADLLEMLAFVKKLPT